MKTHLTGLALLLLMSAALPILADEEEKEETILGVWYAQYGEGEALPKNMTMKIDFKEDGDVIGTMTMEGEEPDIQTWKYKHDEENAQLTLYEVDDEGNVEEAPEVVLNYSFVDEMLIFTYREGPDEEEEEKMELTRNPEGTERHQKMREEAADLPGVRNLEGVKGVQEVPAE
ncbi:MAG: hypothetical protein AAF264_05650 [Pseudomonadota bacterium]